GACRRGDQTAAGRRQQAGRRWSGLRRTHVAARNAALREPSILTSDPGTWLFYPPRRAAPVRQPPWGGGIACVVWGWLAGGGWSAPWPGARGLWRQGRPPRRHPPRRSRPPTRTSPR